MFGDSANNSISGFNIASIQDHLHGAGGNDQIYGNGGDDYLYGEAGNDSMLAGGAGNDTISGGSGTDWLDGGAGDDALTGGTEADQFRFNLNAANGTDTITDFQDGTDLISVYAPTGISINDLTITPINGGADTEIFYTNGTVSTTIVVDGVASSLIDSSDFLFA